MSESGRGSRNSVGRLSSAGAGSNHYRSNGPSGVPLVEDYEPIASSHYRGQRPSIVHQIGSRVVASIAANVPKPRIPETKGSCLCRCVLVLQWCGLGHPSRGWRRWLRFAYRLYTALVLGTAVFHACRASSYIFQHWEGLNVATSFMIAYAVFHLQTLFVALHSVVTLNMRVKTRPSQWSPPDEAQTLVDSEASRGQTLVDYFIEWELRNSREFTRRPYLTFWLQFVMSFVNFTACLLVFILQGFRILPQQFPSDYYFDGVVQDYLLPVFMCHSFLYYCISICIYVSVFALLSDWAALINKSLHKNFQEPHDFRDLLSETTAAHHRLSEPNAHANSLYRLYVTFLLATDLPIFIVLFYVTCLSPSKSAGERSSAGFMALGLLVQMSLLLSPASFHSATTPPMTHTLHERYLSFMRSVRGQESSAHNTGLIQESANLMHILGGNPMGLWLANVCVLKQMVVLSVIVVGIAFSTGYLMLGSVMANCYETPPVPILASNFTVT